MKTLFLLLLSIPFISKGQTYSTCPFDKVLNISAGTPFNARVDFSLQWERLGAGVGLKSLTVTKKTSKLGVQGEMTLEPYFKGDFVLYSEEDSPFRIYAEGYIGLKMIYGGGIKAAWILDDQFMIFALPQYTEQGVQINGGIGLRF